MRNAGKGSRKERKTAAKTSSLCAPSLNISKPPKSISVHSLFFPEAASDIQEVSRWEVRRYWSWPAEEDEFARVGDIALRYRDAKTLREDGWLNDEVMNAYINLISLHCSEALLLSTFFLEILKQKTPSGLFPLDKVHRLLRRKGVDTLFDRQKVVIPANIDNRHWVCYCVDHSAEAISYYDSLTLPESPAGALLSHYLDVETEHLGVMGNRKYRRERAQCARQLNGNDCGVFALLNIRNCAMREQVEVDQSLMPRLRRMITMELKRGRLS